MTEQTETAAHLEAIRRALTAVAEDRPTPEQIAEWNTADKEMAQKVRAALPGVPLHHAYAVLQAARTFQRLDAAAAPAVPAGQAPDTGRAAVTVDAETDEERADREETERDHARGDHTYCGITCEAEMPTEHLRNFVIAKGYPGTKGALDELLRRARTAALPPAPDDRAAVLEEAAAAVASLRGYPTLVTPEECTAELRRLAAASAAVSAVPGRADSETTDEGVDPIESSTEAALGQAQERLHQVLAVAEVIEANGIGWAADSVRRAARGEQPAAGAQQGAESPQTGSGSRSES